MEKQKKKIEKLDEEIKEEKTEEKVKKKNKKKIKKEKINKIKTFFNKPLPIIIALAIICCVQLYFLYDRYSGNAIYIAELNKEDVQIVNIHMFTNNDMNYFYASPAAYVGEDKKIYSFEMGYYIKLGEDKFQAFASRGRELENSSSLKEIVEEMSAWNFFEAYDQDYFFDDNVLNNLDSMYFIIKASTEKGTTDADIVIEYPIDLNKITK